jgi:hypothetical protein
MLEKYLSIFFLNILSKGLFLRRFVTQQYKSSLPAESRSGLLKKEAAKAPLICDLPGCEPPPIGGTS